MKQYKAIIIGLILAALPFNSAFAILGFGIQGGQGLFTVGERNLDDPSGFASMATSEFSNSLNVGVYAYLDIIPFIDLEIDVIDNVYTLIDSLGYEQEMEDYAHSAEDITKLYRRSVELAQDDIIDKINFLATLPSLDELKGQIVGLIMAPAQKIALIVKEPGGQLARLMSSRSKQLEESN